MPKDPAEDAVNHKSAEIVRALARDTGINAKDVEKIMSRLGLESALRNRLAKIDVTNLRVSAAMPKE